MSIVFCRGCGKEIHETALACPHCGAPQKIASNTIDSIPDGVLGWSWGAFLLSWIWAVGNRVWWGLLALIPYVGFVIAIYLGFKGRELAWKSGKWDSVEHFQRVQKKWSQWGVGLVVGLLLIGGILAAIAIPAYESYKNRAEAHEQSAAEVPNYVEEPANVENQSEQIELETAEPEPVFITNTTAETDSQIEITSEENSISPSFDCAKATTNAEVLICNTPELANADLMLANAYSITYQNSSDKELLRSQQNNWRNSERDSCPDANCMLQAYTQRIAELTM